MSKKKMCEFFSDGADVKSFRDNCKGFIYPCPKNTNAKCEIIPKKPKMVRVKAWAGVRFGKVIGVQMYRGKEIFIKPCTILIDEKYLRRKP